MKRSMQLCVVALLCASMLDITVSNAQNGIQHLEKFPGSEDFSFQTSGIKFTIVDAMNKSQNSEMPYIAGTPGASQFNASIATIGAGLLIPDSATPFELPKNRPVMWFWNIQNHIIAKLPGSIRDLKFYPVEGSMGDTTYYWSYQDLQRIEVIGQDTNYYVTVVIGQDTTWSREIRFENNVNYFLDAEADGHDHFFNPNFPGGLVAYVWMLYEERDMSAFDCGGQPCSEAMVMGIEYVQIKNSTGETLRQYKLDDFDQSEIIEYYLTDREDPYFASQQYWLNSVDMPQNNDSVVLCSARRINDIFAYGPSGVQFRFKDLAWTGGDSVTVAGQHSAKILSYDEFQMDFIFFNNAVPEAGGDTISEAIIARVDFQNQTRQILSRYGGEYGLYGNAMGNAGAIGSSVSMCYGFGFEHMYPLGNPSGLEYSTLDGSVLREIYLPDFNFSAGMYLHEPKNMEWLVDILAVEDSVNLGGRWMYRVDDPLAVREVAEVKSLLLYPNPATNIVTLTEKVHQVRLFAIDGKEVFAPRRGKVLDVSSLVKGVYAIHLAHPDGLFVERLIIQ